jgi:hypothetical protein
LKIEINREIRTNRHGSERFTLKRSMKQYAHNQGREQKLLVSDTKMDDFITKSLDIKRIKKEFYEHFCSQI